MTNLRKSRHGVYQVRKVVPDDLRVVVGKREIIRSTGEKDPTRAKRMARQIGDEIDLELEAARRKLQAQQQEKERQEAPKGPPPSVVAWEHAHKTGDFSLVDQLPKTEPRWDPEITYQEAVRLAGVWLARKLETDEIELAVTPKESPVRNLLRSRGLLSQSAPDPEPFSLLHEDYRLAGKVAAGNPALVQEIMEAATVRLDFTGCRTEEDKLERILAALVADPGLTHAEVDLEIEFFLQEQGLNPDPRGNSTRFLRSAICRAWLKALRERRRKQAGDWDLEVEIPTEIPPVGRPATTAPVQNPVVTLTAPASSPTLQAGLTFAQVIDGYEAERKPTPKTMREFRRGFGLFSEITGVKLQDPVTAITKEHVRDFKAALMRMPANTQAARFRGKTALEVIVMTDGENIVRMSAATINKFLGGLKAVLTWAEVNCHIVVNPANRIAVNTKDNGEKKRHPFTQDDLKVIFGSKIFRSGTWSADYWIPLIGLFTGARLEEIGQLTLDDIREEDGIRFIRIDTRGEGQTLKNASSRRQIPIHPRLVELGFLDYVAAIRKQGKTRLFPNLTEVDGKLTKEFSRKFGRLLTRLGITDREKVFHSFRHLYEDTCRRSKLDGRLIDRLMGHATPGMSSRYGHGFTLDVLDEAVRGLRLPDLPEIPLGRMPS